MKRIVVICLILALLVACQPTPETDYVVNRGEEDLEALLHTTPAPDAVPIRDAVAALPQGAKTEAHTVAGRWTEDASDVGGATLRIDADVIVPDLHEWPVYAVEKGVWSPEDRVAILKAAANGAPIYTPGKYLHASKAYYERILQEMQDSERVAAVDRIYAEDPDSEQTWTAFVQEYYRVAPENIELIPFDEAAANGDDTYAFFLLAEPDVYMDFDADETQLTLSVFDQKIQDENYVRQGEWPGAEPGRELVNLSLTLSEAEEKAQAFLKQIGFGDAALSGAETRKAQRSNFYTFAVESEGYLLVFRKGVNGLPAIAPDYPEANVPEETYAAAWPQEYAMLYVDSEGVWSLSWRNPTRITETLTESAALLDFDTALRMIRTRLRTENANAADRMITDVCVTRLRLGYSIVPKKDAPNVGYTLPVWIVDYEIRFEDGRTVPYSFTLNAQNGANLHLDLEGFAG